MRLKKIKLIVIRSGLLLAVALTGLILTACSGGGSGSIVYSIGGSVSGLATGGSVVLQNNGGDDLTVSANGSFVFATELANNSSYNVTVKTQPSGQTCTVTSNTGSVTDANVTNVSVSCVTPAVATTLSAQAKPSSVTLTWTDTGAASYNLYYSTAPGCDTANYTSCPGGTMIPDVSSPYTVSSLTNGQNLWFQVESVNTGGTALSNEAGARPDQVIPNLENGSGSTDVLAMATAADGTTYIGGTFAGMAMNTGYGVPMSMASGYPQAFPAVNGGVAVATSDGNGGWYIGGDFTMVGGQARNYLAHILANGTLDSWNPSANGYVDTLVVDNGVIYVGGGFTTINGTARNYLAAIDTSGSLTAWDPNANGVVRSLAISGSTVYAGGDFTAVSGSTRNYLAAIDTAGNLTSWVADANASVHTLAVANGVLYAGGLFTTIDSGTARNYIAAFDTVSGNLSSWNPGSDGPVLVIKVVGNTVYVGGSFSTFAGSARQDLAAIGSDGTLTSWAPIAASGTALGVIYSLAVSGNTVYVGGGFTSINGISRNDLAAVDTVGNVTAWDPEANYIVYTLAVSGDAIYAGGMFNGMYNQKRDNLAAINSDGSLAAWNPDPGSGTTIDAIAIVGNTVYVGGIFNSIDDGSGAQTRNNLAAIGTDGVLSSWNPNSNNTVYCLAAYGITLYVGGNFSSIAGVSRTRLAAFDTTSGTITSWAPSINNVPYAMAANSSTVYIGGAFGSINDGSGAQTRKYLAATDTAGNLLSWNPNPNGYVRALAFSSGTLYVGGNFGTIDSGTTRNHLAAYDNASGMLTNWDPDANASVYALAVSGSTVYAGGYFTSIGGTTRNYLAAIGTDGLLTAWDPDANYYVFSLAISGSHVFAGGLFSMVGQNFYPNLVELSQ